MPGGPSASTHAVFGQSEMVEAGIMVGPRIYSTGFILYGATIPDMAPINLVVGEAAEWEPGPTLSNSFGFGGHNATLVVRAA